MHGRFAAVALTLILALFGVSCTMHDGGYMPSAAGTWSPMTFQSTAGVPKTVVIVDTRTGETVFELNIPIGKQLSIEFFKYGSRRDADLPPNYMKYTVHSIGRTVGHLDDRTDLPAAWNRRVDIFMRSSEAYTPMEPTRTVEPLGVPLPEAAALSMPSVVPVPEPAQIDKPAAAQTTADTSVAAIPEPDQPEILSEEPATMAEKPAATKATTPDTATLAPPVEPTTDEAVSVDTTSIPAMPLTPATPVEDQASKPLATMTWTDTGHTRRVWVTDIRTGDRVFEVDVPKGSDLTLHFFDMWTPPGTPNDVQSMHWEIVPAGSTVKVPAHHATVPSGPFRRISEQAAEPPSQGGPAATAPPTAKEVPAQPAAESTPVAPVVDLLDERDDDEPETDPKSA
jgi:hypothetical protein